MSMARSFPVKTWKSGRVASRSTSRSHSCCRLSELCFAPTHCGSSIRPRYASRSTIRPYGTNIAPSSNPMKRSSRAATAAWASTHAGSSSALRPFDGNSTGVPPRDAIAPHSTRYASRSNRAPASSATNAPATKSPPVTRAARSSTRSRSAGSRSCTYPVSMFTAGVSPAPCVRATCASKLAQSMSPSTVYGSRTADIPVIARPGRIGGIEFVTAASCPLAPRFVHCPAPARVNGQRRPTTPSDRRFDVQAGVVVGGLVVPEVGDEIRLQCREGRIAPAVHLLERVVGQCVELTLGAVVHVPGPVGGAHPSVARHRAQVHAHPEQLAVPFGEHALGACGGVVDRQGGTLHPVGRRHAR